MDGIAGIDHVIVAVRELEGARTAWRRLGFTLSPRGRHIGQGTGNYCVMFPADYIELLGVVDPADSVDRIEAFLARREGPMGLAFAPAGSAEDARAALLAPAAAPVRAAPARPPHRAARGNRHAALQPGVAAGGGDPRARQLFVQPFDARADAAAGMALPPERCHWAEGGACAGRAHRGAVAGL